MSVIFGIDKPRLKPHAVGIVPGIQLDKWYTELRLLPDYVQITWFYLSWV